ncbi:MAG: hypothetical protein ACM3SO_23145 [Betaproteobacteria bacterium]
MNNLSALTRLALVAACTAGLAGIAHGKAVPATVVSFDGGNCSAKFVRSSSGIVNETNRTCLGAQNPWTSANVILQFRPLDSTPNPACDPVGLVASFGPWSTSEATLVPFFLGGTYNVCVYLENPVVASGSIASNEPDGTDTAAMPLAGQFDVCVSGTWQNRGGVDLIDAEYISQDNWVTSNDGLPSTDAYAYLGPNFADVQVDDNFVDWGAYNAGHNYCVTQSLALGQALNLAVFDGDGVSGVKQPGWYGDNVGSLSFTVKYLGQ